MRVLPLWNLWPQFVRIFGFFDWRVAVSLPILLFASACGSGGGTEAVPLVPTITTQPTAQSTPVGQTATFMLAASGTSPLRYQWSKNGTVISGATGASYTTPSVVATDNGSSFTVTVSNVQGSVTSDAALLTVGPRTPQAGDWRFQGMDLPAGTAAGNAFLLSFGTATATNFLGTPFEVPLIPGGFFCGTSGPGDCEWPFFGSSAPSGAAWPTSVYKSDALSNLDADLNAMATGNIVITSLDLEPINQIFAVSSLQTSAAGGFQYASQTVPPDQIQAVATQEGAKGRVVTAVAFDGAGAAHVVSYGWQSDTITAYEASVVTTTSSNSDTVVAEITDLANRGYIITAMGGDPTNGLVLFGTRVQGDTLPRPLEVFLTTGHQGQISNAVQPVWRTVAGTSPSFSVQFAEQ